MVLENKRKHKINIELWTYNMEPFEGGKSNLNSDQQFSTLKV